MREPANTIILCIVLNFEYVRWPIRGRERLKKARERVRKSYRKREAYERGRAREREKIYR